jgi:hypothetical protein
MFMRAVLQNMFLNLYSAPVTFELIGPSVPVILWIRKLWQAKLKRQERQTHDVFFCHPTSQEHSPKVYQNVCHKSS